MRTQSLVLLGVIATLITPSSGASNGTGTCARVQAGDSTSGLLDAVTSYRNTLGYAGLDSIDARKAEETEGEACTLKIAKIINKKGVVVTPTSDGAQAAARSNAKAFATSSCPGFGLCADIYDGKDADVWPISTLTYMIVPTNTTDWEEGCDKMKTLYEYVRWILEDNTAADIAKELSMATMPVIIAQQAKALLDEMQCYDSANGLHFVRDRPPVTTSATRTLAGSGSSLQKGMQERLTTEYFRQNFVSISYTPSSSGTGRSALKAREFDFAGSDSILDMTDPEFIKRGMKMIPAFAAAVGVVYNLDQVEDLVLSRDVMQKIFTGEIFSWSDPAIVANNPAIAHLLPDEAIIRTVRAARSGSTQALTRALYSFAEHPTDKANLDYDLHPLQGSGLPDWPMQPQPYPGNTVCNFARCIRAVCEPGHYLSDPESEDPCVECPLGTFSDVRGQHTECKLCPAGSYTNTIGNSKCVKCDDQKYQDKEGQELCKVCPANSRRFSVQVDRDGTIERVQAPGVDVEECKCIAGFWLPESVSNSSLGGKACQTCPDGAVCHGFPRNIPQTKVGFWGDPEHPNEFFECGPGACQAEYVCSEAHEGRMCGTPVEGYFTVGELWYIKCPADAWRGLFTLVCVFAVVLIWVLLHHFSLKYDAFSIAFLFFQMVGLISKFRLRWHPNLEFVLIALRVINFDVDFFGPHCMFPGWDWATAYFTQLLLPFFVVACYTASFYISKFIRQRKAAKSSAPPTQATIENKGYLRSTAYQSSDLRTFLTVKGLSFFIMMFHTLAYRAFAVFVCEPDPSGASFFMNEAPAITCWTGRHIAMTVFSVLYIPTIIIGIPFHLFYKMCRMKQEDRLNEFSVTVSYWFIFAKFKVGFPFWEMVLLARRFVLVLLVVFVPVSMLQAALTVAFLNCFLYLHLKSCPFKDKRVGLLDSFGVCCAMAFAVCGMLFYPSLDNTLQCVGSTNLDDLGEQCQRNLRLKQETSVVLLLLLFFTMLAALYITVRDIQEKFYSEAAAKKIEADKKWYGKDKLFKAIQQMPKHQRTEEKIAAICSNLGSEQSTHMQTLHLEQAHLMSSAKDVTKGMGSPLAKARKAVDLMLGFREAQSKKNLMQVQQHDFAKPEKLNLCDMLVGDCLQSWHKSLSTLSEKELAVRLLFADNSESQSMKQELAYMDLEMWIPTFALQHELINGFFSNNELARILRLLVEELPELINWLATVEGATVQSFSNFVNAYTIFAKTRGDGSALYKLVVPGHKAQVVHWLMQCSTDEQRGFRTIFGAMSDKVLDDNNTSFLSRVSRAVSPSSPASPLRSNRVNPLPPHLPVTDALTHAHDRSSPAVVGAGPASPWYTSSSPAPLPPQHTHATLLIGQSFKAPPRQPAALEVDARSGSWSPLPAPPDHASVVVHQQAAAVREANGNGRTTLESGGNERPDADNRSPILAAAPA